MRDNYAKYNVHFGLTCLVSTSRNVVSRKPSNVSRRGRLTYEIASINLDKQIALSAIAMQCPTRTVSRPYQACAPDANRLIERSREEEKEKEEEGASKKGRKTEGARKGNQFLAWAKLTKYRLLIRFTQILVYRIFSILALVTHLNT